MMGTYYTLACRREVVQDAIDLCITQAPLNNRNFSLGLDCYEVEDVVPLILRFRKLKLLSRI
jgi:hypothetical protein